MGRFLGGRFGSIHPVLTGRLPASGIFTINDQYYISRDGGWIKPITATGGTVFTPGDGYKYHAWTTSATPGFEITDGSAPVEILVVAGGGGGGSYTGTAYTDGTTGQNSVLGPPSGTPGVDKFVAYGGGGAGAYSNHTGDNGGSGGGGGSTAGVGGNGLNPSTPAPVIATFPDYIPGTTQGYNGGNGGSPWEGGGGGGAGQVGANGGPGAAGGEGGQGIAMFNGAPGVPNSYGTPGPTPGRWVGGGGGEGHWPSGTQPAGAGGAGGGGAGANGSTGSAGTVNTGGGGGGGDSGSGAGHGGGGAGGVLRGAFTMGVGTYPVTIGGGGAGSPRSGQGGSGLVIVRYLSA